MFIAIKKDKSDTGDASDSKPIVLKARDVMTF